MEFISSNNNERIKSVIKLLNDKKTRKDKNLFVIDGIKLLDEAKKNKIKIQTIFVTKKFFNYNEYYLNTIGKNIEKIVISENVCKKISRNITPQGIFGICEIPKQKNFEVSVDQSKNILILINLQDVGNFGTIIRTASALGIDFILVNRECPDIYGYKVLRSSMGGVFNIGITEIEDPLKAISFLKNNGFIIYASSVSDKSEKLGVIKFGKKNVIVIGNEGNGLDKTVMENCDKAIKIPMDNNVDSLNVAVATGIILWNLRNRDL